MSTDDNAGKKIAGNKKRLLFITLFVVPFFVGMALIFMGKNIASLPVMHPVGEQLNGGKSSTVYYRVPEFSFSSLEEQKISFLNSDSSLFLLTLFQLSKKEEWEKHMMYHTKIIERYSNVKVYTIYEGNPEVFEWAEDPIPFFGRFKSWYVGYLPTNDFESLVFNLKLVPDSITGIYPYVIIDKEKQIRAYCNINDLKAARDIPKMLKILHNQYAPKRAKVTQKRY